MTDNGMADRGMRARLTAAVVEALARRTRYLESELLGLRHLVGAGSVCADVGAAAGLYTQALSQLAGPSGQVHSVEPLAFAHPVWTRVLGTRNAPNVRQHAMALGAEPGRGLMSVPVGRYGMVTGRSFLADRCRGLGSNAEFGGQVDVSVPVGTLDGLGLSRLDFIKIDVEGGELGVLHGGAGVIDAFRPALLVEIEARHTARYEYGPPELAGWLARRGYQMYAWRQGWQEARQVRPEVRNYLFRQIGQPWPRAAGVICPAGAASRPRTTADSGAPTSV
jgi:FkbM family methyltransferase